MTTEFACQSDTLNYVVVFFFGGGGVKEQIPFHVHETLAMTKATRVSQKFCNILLILNTILHPRMRSWRWTTLYCEIQSSPDTLSGFTSVAKSTGLGLIYLAWLTRFLQLEWNFNQLFSVLSLFLFFCCCCHSFMLYEFEQVYKFPN